MIRNLHNVKNVKISKSMKRNPFTISGYDGIKKL